MKRQNSPPHTFFRIKLHHVRWLMISVGFILIHSCQSSDPGQSESKSVPMDSLQYYSDILSRNPSDAETLIQRARLSYEQRSYGAALKDLEKAMQIDSLDMEIYLLKSQVEMDYFRSLQSVGTLQKAERIWPNSGLIKENLAQTFLILKQYDQAVEKANQALEVNPGAARPYLYLGMIAKEKQDTTAAIGYLQQAVQNDADLLDAWIELARIQMKKNPTDAAVYFKSALEIAPDDLLIWHAYAMFWQNRDSLEQAKESYNRMINLDSGYTEAYYNQALILMDQDSFQTAIPLWDQYIHRNSDLAKGYYYRGICNELTQNLQKALEDYRAAKNLEPGLANIDQAIQSMKTKIE